MNKKCKVGNYIKAYWKEESNFYIIARILDIDKHNDILVEVIYAYPNHSYGHYERISYQNKDPRAVWELLDKDEVMVELL